MPSDALPLKLKLGIREHWDKEDGPLQKALSSLTELSGLPVDVAPEWPLLLVELDKFYVDKSHLASAIAGCVETWAKSAYELLDDEAHEAFADVFCDKAKARIRLFLEVSKNDKASTSWAEDRSGFFLRIPKKTLVSANELFPTFRGALLTVFDEPKASSLAHRDSSSATALASTAAADDWADVAVDRTTGTPAVVEKAAASHPTLPLSPAGGSTSRYQVDFLPAATSLPRPDELLLRPPYHLTVHDLGRQKVEVTGSHSPSLQVLADYLKRWCRTNHNDTRNPPAVEVLLEQAPWGLGMMYDRLLLTTENTRYTKQFALNPSIVLAMVEGVLGYEQVSVHAGQWTYRRDAAFK